MAHQTSLPAPLSQMLDLSDLTHAGTTVDIVPDAETLDRLRRWIGVSAIRALIAKVTLKKLSPTRFDYAAELTADVEQPCVVTLEPVVSRLAIKIHRELHYTALPERDAGELTLAAGDEETPDEIDSLRYDVVGPLLEEFSLNIDPYPRKEGAVFQVPQEAEAQEGPFAALKAWKKTDAT